MLTPPIRRLLRSLTTALILLPLALPCAADQTLPQPPPVSESVVSTAPSLGPTVQGSSTTGQTTSVAPPVSPPTASLAPTDDNRIYVQAAEDLKIGANNIVTLTGNVQVRFQDYTLYADTATLDTHSGVATFSGNVRMESKDQSTSIESKSPTTILVLNLKNGDYAIHGAEGAIISPDLLENSGLLLPLRVDSSDITSSGGIIDARSAGFTTCDFAEPHYDFGVRSLTIIPGKRLIARNVVLYRRGRRVLEFREVILPLENRYERSGYLPTIGDDAEEGAFVKWAYPYALNLLAVGIVHLDFTQFQGVGTGFDQNYVAHGAGGGTLSIYHLDNNQNGLQEFTGSLSHHQSIGSFKLGIDSQYENNSYFSATGASDNITNRVTLSQISKSSQTQLTSTLEQSDYGEGLSSNFSSALTQQERLSNDETADLKLNYASFMSPSIPALIAGGEGIPGSTQGSLSADLALHFAPQGLHVDVETNTFSTFGSSSQFGGVDTFGGLERRPDVMLTTSGFGSDMLDRLAELVHGSQVQLGFGSYFESASNTDSSRLFFGYDSGSHVKKLGLFSTTTDSSFQQSFYGDGGARYILNGNYGSAYHTGQFQLGANYTTLRAYGFTPFFFDQSGTYNTMNFSLTYAEGKSFDMTAGTAYDFDRDQGEFGLPAAPWENLLTVLRYHPSDDFSDSIQTTYDPNHNTLYDISSELDAKNSAGFGLHTEMDYFAEQHAFGDIDGSLDLPIITDEREQAGYKLQLLGGYNGITDQFTYQGISLTRSWHDWELTGTFENNPEGIPAGQTFYLTFHLKAFPGYQPFGIGAYGQGVASGIGQVY